MIRAEIDPYLCDNKFSVFEQKIYLIETKFQAGNKVFMV